MILDEINYGDYVRIHTCTSVASTSMPDSVTFTEGTTLTITYCSNAVQSKFQESKKQRIARIAKEKMFASWKMYNQKTEKTIKIIQVCKPRHKLNQMGRRR